MSNKSNWPIWRKISFRFFFIYFCLFVLNFEIISDVPGVSYLVKLQNFTLGALVEAANKYIFHIREVLVPMAGSGDTSFGWAQLYTYLLISLIGCIFWSIFDSKRNNYEKLDYWLRTSIRYYTIIILLLYGIIKIFLQQMIFPSISQLATPLGDFLPMRFSWLFIGYSEPYQIFSGTMEVFAALLMLYRGTLKFGLFVAFTVFINVMMLNLCYDVPVKIFSIQLTFACFYLLVNNFNHYFSFFVQNKITPSDNSYNFEYDQKWMKWGRIIIKTAFIIYALILPLYDTWNNYSDDSKSPDQKPFNSGVYNIKSYVVNKDTIPNLPEDTLRWKDIIFEKRKSGSINTSDTLFRYRYGRAYFSYTVDTVANLLNIKKLKDDSTFIFSMKYQFLDSNNIRLKTRLRKDSLYIVITKSKKHFQLAERQFHWLSEDNR